MPGAALRSCRCQSTIYLRPTLRRQLHGSTLTPQRPLLLNPAQRRSFAKRATPAGKPGQQRQQRSGRLLAPVSPHTACRAPRLDRRKTAEQDAAKSFLIDPRAPASF